MKRAVRNRGAVPGPDASPTAAPVPPGQEGKLFAEYVLPEVEVLYRVAFSLTRHHADAQDLVQETLLRAYRAIGRFDGRHPRAWLLTILRNAHRNCQRGHRPDLLADHDSTFDRLESAAPAGGDPGEAVIRGSFDTVVVSSLRELPVKLRRVVELVDIDGLTYGEAAETLGVPVGTVMSRLHRARRRLRSRLLAAGMAGTPLEDE